MRELQGMRIYRAKNAKGAKIAKKINS